MENRRIDGKERGRKREKDGGREKKETIKIEVVK